MQKRLWILAGLLFCLWFSGATWAQALKASSIIGKTLPQVEAVLGKHWFSESSGPIGDYRTGYRFSVEGFAYVSVGFSQKRGMTGIAFAFPIGMSMSRSAALDRVGVSKLPPGWLAQWSVEKPSGNGILFFRPIDTSWLMGNQVYENNRQKMDISQDSSNQLIFDGKKFYDPKNNDFIRWASGIYVVMTKDGDFKAVVRGDVKRHWRPL